MEKIQFGYYHGTEADQFTFYRVPKLLIKDEMFKDLSSDAKLLYGLMLDRMSLSVKNGWLDDENRVFIIYSIESISEDMNCGRDKAMRIIAELDSIKGIGLIERVKRGQGKPDLIYVMNFVSGDENEGEDDTNEFSEVVNVDFKKSESADLKKSQNPTSESGEIRLQGENTGFLESQESENPTSRGEKSRLLDVGICDSNKNNINNNYLNETENLSINPSRPIRIYSRMDGRMDNLTSIIDQVKENINYEYLMQNSGLQDRELYEALYQVICNVLCGSGDTIRVGQTEYPYDFVKDRFLKLKADHLELVAEGFKNCHRDVKDINAYMLVSLFNAVTSIDIYWTKKVQHDMYGGGWSEKGAI